MKNKRLQKAIKIRTPLSEKAARSLRAGDLVSISGIIYTGRDAAHKKLCDALSKNKKLPLKLEGEIIYFVGPCPARPGKPIGSAGPTTSYRMDAYSPALILKMGLRGMIGKGQRSRTVVDAMKKKGAVYFAATGGAGALLADTVKKAEAVLYRKLGPEAVYRLEVEDFPAVVAVDTEGNDLYETGPAKYRKK